MNTQLTYEPIVNQYGTLYDVWKEFNFSLLDSTHIISKLNGNVAHTCTTEILQKTYELSGFVVKGVEKPLG